MRLQVFLAKSGVSSRRKSLEFIKQGFVKVNSRITLEPSTQVFPQKDKVEFNGKEVKPKEFIYILLNKPKGIVTTKKDKFADKTIVDLLPKGFCHLNPCGRLDKDTTGLLFLTNDGELLYRLTHPKFEIKKTYFAKVRGEVSQIDKAQLEARPSTIKLISFKNNLTESLVEIKEGKKRQIRLMFEAINHPVVELKRIKEGALTLGDLKVGEWRFLSEQEIIKLYKEVGLNK